MKVRLLSWSSKAIRPNDNEHTWGSFSCIDLETSAPIQIVGVLPNQIMKAGAVLAVDGYLANHLKYGWQFKFEIVHVLRPAGKEEIIAFLQMSPGIGEKTAKKIWERFGKGSLNIVSHYPERLTANKILSDKKAEIASNVIRDLTVEAELITPLTVLLSGIGFPKSLPKTILDQRWGDPIAKIKANPFHLVGFLGVGFIKADALRKKLYLPPDMVSRQDAAVQYVFEKNENTSVWVWKNDVYCDLKKLLNSDLSACIKIITRNLNSGVIRERERNLALSVHANKEIEAAKCLFRLVQKTNTWPNPAESDRLTLHQKHQIQQAQRNGTVAFLLGSAGTGKTECTAEILQACIDNGDTVAVAAPTGKAMLKLQQTLQLRGLQGVEVATIHRLLGARPNSRGFEFTVNVLDVDLLVLDEISMLDNSLAVSLFSAVRPGTKILLVGDPNQLPPVGHGTLLRDWKRFVDSNSNGDYTYGALSEIHRNAGEIVRVCDSISQGNSADMIPFERYGQADKTNNLQHSQILKSEDIHRAVLDFFVDVIDPSEVQVITPTNKSGLVSKESLNRVLQKKLNPCGAGSHKIYKAKDRVIVTKNTWVKPPDGADHDRVFLANGSIGYVFDAKPKYVVVKMEDYPGQQLLIPTGEGEGNLSLAYAITGHKAQGSQWRIVVVVVDGSYASHMVADRGWLYTAISRAETFCYVIGDRAIINRAVAKSKITKRVSFMQYYFEKMARKTT